VRGSAGGLSEGTVHDRVGVDPQLFVDFRTDPSFHSAAFRGGRRRPVPALSRSTIDGNADACVSG